MNARDEIGGTLRELGRRLGLGLQLDDAGCCAMVYGDGKPLDLWVPEAGSVVVLHTELGSVPMTGREAFLASLLALNLHGIETDGCIIGLDLTNDKVLLSLNRHATGLDTLGLENVLGNFVEVAERLRARVTASAETANARPMAAFGNTEIWQNLHLRA